MSKITDYPTRFAEAKNAPLSQTEAQAYHVLLDRAWTMVTQNNGTEKELDDLAVLLQEMETIIRERTGASRLTNQLEQDFGKAADWSDPKRTAVIEDVFGAVAKNYHQRLENAAKKGLDELLNTLQLWGVRIEHVSGKDFIQTNPDEAPPPSHLDSAASSHQEHEIQHRLSWLVAALPKIGVYTDDFIISVCERDSNKRRPLPYILVEIPRLSAQIAVCDVVGEITFVSTSLYEHDMWQRLKKRELEMVPGIRSIICHNQGQWLGDIFGIIQSNSSLDSEQKEKKKIDLSTTTLRRDNMPLSVSLIAQSLIADQDPETGDYPKIRSGIIQNGPLANGVRTWKSVDNALTNLWRQKDGDFIQNTSCGLSRDLAHPNYCPYRGLGEIKEAHGLIPDPLSVPLILESLIADRDPETGTYPTVDSGIIQNGPLANGVRTWKSIHSALTKLWLQKDGDFTQNTSCGLSRDLAHPNYCPYRGLGEIKEAHGLIPDPLSVPLILESLIADRDPETGTYPTVDSGIIQNGPLANGVRTWVSVNSALVNLWRQKDGDFIQNTSFGLSRDLAHPNYCPYRGLGEIKEAHGLIPDPLSVPLILESLIADRDPETGDYPKIRSGIIQNGPLANGVRTWKSVDNALTNLWLQKDGDFIQNTSCGLSRDLAHPNYCPYRGLGEIKKDLGIGKKGWTVDIPLEPAA
jgi:hypothetical protein